MNRQAQISIAGFALLLPALVLVTSGVLELDQPAALVHPVLVMGGLFGGLALNAIQVVRIRVGLEGGNL
jgi:hypothetical protein